MQAGSARYYIIACAYAMKGVYFFVALRNTSYRCWLLSASRSSMLWFNFDSVPTGSCPSVYIG